ncbi:hypothetical protein C4J94_3203 [Pseudomonas sp. R5-89-07]|nr:hypothetical protein C4J94_3203 [Pseudomonas sp. R5-89-07]
MFKPTKSPLEHPILLLCQRLAPLPGGSRIGARTWPFLSITEFRT